YDHRDSRRTTRTASGTPDGRREGARHQPSCRRTWRYRVVNGRNVNRTGGAARASAPAQVETGNAEAREPFAGGGRHLRFLLDALELERPFERQVAEREPDVAHAHPGPRQPQRRDQQQHVDEVQAEHGPARDAGAKAGDAETRVVPEESAL